MKNISSNVLLILFLIQILAQIALMSGSNPYNSVLTPDKEATTTSTKNNGQLNKVISQNDQINNKTDLQKNLTNSGNTNNSINKVTSTQSIQTTESTNSLTSNPPANIDFFKYKQNITLDHTKFSTSFSNYPLLLYITNANLVTYAKPDGRDIAFFGTDGSLLSYSIVAYNAGNLESWVNIPSISSSVDTVIFLAYGNQSLSSYQNSMTVWNSNYYVVLHLNETSGSIVYDATANGNNGQRYSTTVTTGIVDNGQTLSGSSSSYITDTANPTGSVTIGFWFKLANTFNSYSSYSQILLTKYIDDNTNMHVILKGQDYSGGTGSFYNHYYGSLTLKVKNSYGANYQSTSRTTWNSNTWYYIVIVVNSVNGANKIYVNGVLDTYATAGSGYGSLPNTNNFVLGGGSVDTNNLPTVTSNNYLNGEMDEFWIMSGTQSSSYISATYNNINNPSSFVKSIGQQENNYPTITQNSYVLGVNDNQENGHPTLWALINNGWHHTTTSVTMKINSTISNANYTMSFNGTMWIVSSFLPQYDKLYSYSVINATDGYSHYLSHISLVNNYNFSNDRVAPTILEYGYNPTEGANGTFWAQAADTWGVLGSVTLNVTQCDCQVPKGVSTVTQMNYNGTLYIITWLIMGSDVNINYNITAHDIAGNTITTPLTFSYVANKPPWVTNVALNSISFTANDNLYVNFTYHDYDNNMQSGTKFNWYKNNILQPTFNYTNVIDKSYLHFGDNWSVMVIPSDGITFGTPGPSNTVTIKKAVPLITSISITSNPKTLNNLSVNWVPYDADGINITGYNVTWYVNSTYKSAFQNITTIYHGYTNKSQTWTAVVRIYNGYNYSANYSVSTTIQDTAPVISNVGFNVTSPITPSTPFAISFKYFDADDNETAQSRYISWYINGTLNTFLANIAQFNAANYTGIWNYFLTVSDGQLNSSTVLSGTLTVGNVAANHLPVASNVTITTADLTVSSDLYLNYNYTDADGNLQSGTTIYWYQNGYIQPNLNNSLIVSHTLLTKGNTWRANVTPSDGIGYGNSSYSNTVTIRNSPPLVVGNLLSISQNIYTSSNISASLAVYDVNNDKVNSTITWYRKPFSGAWTLQSQYNETIQISSSISSPTITFQVNSSSTVRLDSWYYTVQLFDGSNYSQTYQSPVTTILNSIPSLSDLTFNQTNNIRTNDSILAFAGYNDDDNDPMVNYTITWYKNGNVNGIYSGGSTFDNGFILFSNMTIKGEYWSYKLQVSDGFNNSISYSPSKPIQISNTPPIVMNLTITPSDPLVTTDLGVNYNYFDIDHFYNPQMDSQSGTLIYWYKNNVLQPFLTNSLTVSKSLLVKNDIWKVTVIPSDGSSYGQIYNSSVVIGNSLPVVSQVSIQNNFGNNIFSTSNNIMASYTVTDPDVQDTVFSYNITWYINGTYNSNFDNYKTILSQYTIKHETWQFKIQVSDGTNVSVLQSSNIITILNSPPNLTNYIFNQTSNINTLTNLKIVYNYTDGDGDNVSNYVANFSIRWYLFVGGQYINEKNGSLYLFANETSKGEYWYYTIQVFDGENYSEVYQSLIILIGDSIPIITSLNIISTNLTADGYLQFHYTYSDADLQDSIQQVQIRWYMNNSLQSDLNNTQIVNNTYLKRGQHWFFTLQISDGYIDPNTNLLVWSSLNTSSLMTIANFIPIINNAGFVSSQYQNFIVQGQNLSLQYKFYDADSDTNKSIVHWYKDNQYMPQFDNLSTITADNIQANQTWYYNVTPYDGIATGKSVISSSEFIESKANISIYGVSYTTNQEGNFIFWAEVHDLLHENTLSVQFYVKLENMSVVLINANNNGTDWIGLYDFTNLAIFSTYLNTTMNINIKAQTQVGLISITSEQSFISKIIDNSPPRVTNVNYIFDNPNNPTNITFYANIQEYGSGVKSVILYYDFETISNDTGSNISNSSSLFYKIALSTNFTGIQMVAFNSTYYTITIPVDFKANTYILYRIQTQDNAGNINPNAYPLGLNKNRPDAIFTFKPNSGLNINDVIIIVLAVTVILIGISFVAIKKFRSTELVGLDKDLVISKLDSFKFENELSSYLNLHTLGIIVSFFDQRHGPIPIIVTPDILQDNYNLLVELSDLSFSSARFSGNFEDEVFSTYNFNPGPGQFINIISFGFALNRPTARGGAENITLNILLHKNVNDLINQFIDKFQDKIHEIHLIMDKRGTEKELIGQKIKELRLYLTKIVLTYEKLYGTTELLDNYDKIFD